MIEIIRAIGAFVVALQGTPATDSTPITLDQAIKIAENHAFAVRIQQSVVEKNGQKVNESRATLGPNVSLGGTYLRYDREVTASFGQGTPPVVIQPIDSKTANATLTLPLDIAGNRSRLLHASEANRRSSKQTLKATYNDTRLSVRQAYFAVLRAKALIEVDEKALADAKGRLDQGQKQFDQQQVARLDVTRYEAQVAQATSDLLSAKDNLILANYAFNYVLARPIEMPVSLVDISDLPALDSAEDTLVKTAQTKRPEILASLESLRALGLITRATESGMNPSLSLQIQYQRTIDPQGLSSVAGETTGTLMLSIPVFDSGSTRAKVKEARQDEVQAKLNFEQTRLLISQDVRNAVANLGSAKARLDNAIQQVKLAEEVFRLAKVKQDAGTGTYYEVIDAESQLTQARNGEVSARYDYLTSYSQLQRAVGADDIAAAVADYSKAPKGGK